MASVFWDAKGILLIDYLEKGKTIMGEYYACLLDKLDEKIREKRPGLAKKKNLVSSGQCAHTQICFGDGENQGFEVQIGGTCSLFSRFGSLRLSSVPKPQEICKWKAFPIK